MVRSALEPLRRTDMPLRLWVACSGGPDSVALLGLLHLLSHRDKLVLGVGHVDHGLRPESPAEAEHVSRLGASLGVPVSVTSLAIAPGPNLARRARDARRAALAAGARGFEAAAVALGHTATDRAETLLLHLVRGASLDGLAAMGAQDRDPVALWIRPVLGLTREETRALCGRLELACVDDPTNLDPTHPRVAIRREVLPRLRALRDGADLAIASAAESVREARDALAGMVDTELAARVTLQQRLDVTGIADLPRAFRTRLVRAFCLRAGVEGDALGRRTIADVDRALLTPGPRRSWDLAGELRVVLERRHLWVEGRA